MKRIQKQQGFIKWILIIIVALVLASYFFDFSVEDAVEDEQTQSNANYITTHVTEFWEDHLAGPATYLWNDVFIDLLWESFVNNMERVRDGEPNEFEESSPGVNTEVNTTAEVTNPAIGEEEREE